MYNYYTNTYHFGCDNQGNSITSNTILYNCYNCKNYDKNDYVHCYGTCEIQDEDFRIDHFCNIKERFVKNESDS